MNYLYYPGCCCGGLATGKPYKESLQADFEALGITTRELEDWNCCGATVYMSVDERKAFALAARNLALAERQASDADAHAQLITPCSACYMALNKAQHYLHDDDELGHIITNALHAANLRYTGRVDVRHPLDVLVNDYGLDEIKKHVMRPLTGLRVASYYGCLLVRPYSTFDDQHHPMTMDNLMAALGAEPVDWPLKTRCCGGSLTGTLPEIGIRLSYILLGEARKHGADIIATACPFCQFNLECYQEPMQKLYPDHKLMPTAFFSQLVGWALGIPARKLGMQRMFVPLEPTLTAKSAAGGIYVRS